MKDAQPHLSLGNCKFKKKKKMRYHDPPIRRAKIQNTENTKGW